MDIRLAKTTDGPSCNKFHNRIYGRQRTYRQWHWEFAQRISEKDTLPFVYAMEGSDVIGTQAFIPIRFIDKDGVFWTAKSEETLVDPNMRGQNVFSRMYDLAFEVARNADYKSIWGFTPAERAFTRIGFEIPTYTKQIICVIGFGGTSTITDGRMSLGPTSKVLLPLADLAMLSWSFLIRTVTYWKSRRIEIVTLEDPEEIHERLSKDFISTYGGTTILRDASYLRWRFFENPYCKATVLAAVMNREIIAYLAFSVDIEGKGHIVDVIAANPDHDIEIDRMAIRGLLSESIRRMRRMGAKAVRGWTLNDHKFDQLMRRLYYKAGFVKVSRGSAVVLHTNFGQVGRKDHGNFLNWYVTRAFTEGTNG
jgi:GNAT superfamily N-acetyltransferase